MADPGAADEAERATAANRDLWTRINAEYTDEQAMRSWAAGDISWGDFNVPEAELNLLGDVAGLDVVDLGCGTAYLSAWLAQREARPVGVDPTPAQLDTARRCQARSGLSFPLIEADAAQVPLPSASFDLAVSEFGASLWCPADRWVPEAARLLRPGGRLVFLTSTVLVTMCLPAGPGYARRELRRPQRDVARMRTPDGGVEFHRSHGEWIAVLHESGFTVDALHELYAPPDAQDHPYYDLVTADWARKWPAEEVWVAHL